MRLKSIFHPALLLEIASCAIAYPTATPPPKVDGRVFNIDGKTQYFAGTNAWWMGHLYEDADVDYAMSQIAASNLKVTRVWGFGNSNTPSNSTVYYQLLQSGLNKNGSAINWGPNGIARLDSAVVAAEKYDVKLVLPMLNNWDDLGGINTYSTAFGCNATTFYTHTACQSAYKNWIKFVIKRYMKSPAIFAWELCNECRCHGCSTTVITNWATDISQYIKSLDSKHLVTMGDEGWFAHKSGRDYSGDPDWKEGADYGTQSYAYGGLEGVDFVENLKIETLDYATFHLYPNSWNYNNSNFGSDWIEQHADAGRKAGKPVILEEYGTEGDKLKVLGEWQRTVLQQTKLAADQWWQFSTALPSGNNPFDDYAIAYNATAGSLYDKLVLHHAQKMAAKVAGS